MNNFEGSNMYFQAKSHRRYSPYKSQFYQSEQTNPVDQQNIVGRILINYRKRSYLIYNKENPGKFINSPIDTSSLQRYTHLKNMEDRKFIYQLFKIKKTEHLFFN